MFKVGHVVPEAAKGGPIALVADGDMVSIDVGAKTLELEVDAPTLAARRAAWAAPPRKYGRGILARYHRLVSDASHGCVLSAEEDYGAAPLS